MNVWMIAGLWLALYGIVALGVGLYAGLVWGLLCLVLALLLSGAWQIRQLNRFVHWARQPAGTQPLENSGIWEDLSVSLTKRVRAANALRDELKSSLERFREAAEAMPDGVLILIHGRHIDWFNSAAAAHFGLLAGTDERAPLGNLVRRPELLSYLGQGRFTEPLVLRPQRAGQATLMVQIVPFGQDQILVMSRDISQLERLERMRSDFVANVSHELKTPLTVVVGFIETLLDFDDQVSPDESRHYLGLAHEQARRMKQLVEDLLTLSSLETQAPAPMDQSVGLVELARQILGETQALAAGHRDITLIEGPSVTLLGSANEIHSALGNLASNAVRYSGDGGHVELSWSLKADGSVTFEVRDDGIGISPEHLPRLTERFYRVDRSRSRQSGGTGLGLAIVKHVMTRHQGELRIESELGAGSRFIACFPALRVR